MVDRELVRRPLMSSVIFDLLYETLLLVGEQRQLGKTALACEFLGGLNCGFIWENCNNYVSCYRHFLVRDLMNCLN